MDKIKIMSLNVRGLQNQKKRHKVYTMLKQQQADIFLVQETHCTESHSQLWQTEWGSTILNAYGTSRSCGVAVMFNKKRKTQVHQVISDVNGRYIVLDISINNAQFTLINLYAPNIDSPDFFVEIFRQADLLANKELMIAADFNLVMNAQCDRFPPTNYNE